PPASCFPALRRPVVRPSFPTRRSSDLSSALFDDPSDEGLVLRGHLLHKTGAAPVTDPTGTSVSYNYTPRSGVYSDANGKACDVRSEEHTSELQSRFDLVCRLLLDKKKR